MRGRSAKVAALVPVGAAAIEEEETTPELAPAEEEDVAGFVLLELLEQLNIARATAITRTC